MNSSLVPTIPPKSPPIPPISIQEKSNSDLVKPIMIESLIATTAQASAPTKTKVQSSVVKKESAFVPVPRAAVSNETSPTKSIISKQNAPISTCQSSSSNQTNAVPSYIKKESAPASLSRASPTYGNLKRENVPMTMPQASVSNTVTIKQLGPRKENPLVSMPEADFSKKANTTQTEAKKEPTPVSNISLRITSPSLSAKMKTANMAQTFQVTSAHAPKHQKRLAETTVASKAKKMRVISQEFTAGGSNSTESVVKHASAVHTSKKLGRQSNHNKNPTTAKRMAQRYLVNSSSTTQGYQMSSCMQDLTQATFVVPRGSPTTKVGAAHGPPLTTIAVPHAPPVKNTVSQARLMQTTTASSKGIQVTQGRHEDATNSMQKSLQHQNLPKITNSAPQTRLTKTPSSLQCCRISSSFVPNVEQTMQVDTKSQTSNLQSNSSSIVQGEATKAARIKSTCSTPLIPTIKKVTTSARKHIARMPATVMSMRPGGKVSMIQAKVPKQVSIRPPEAKLKRENTAVVQPRVTPNLCGKFQKCEKREVSRQITQRTPCLLAGSHKSHASVSPAYNQTSGKAIPVNPNKASIGKLATASKPATAVRKMITDSVKPLPPGTQPIITSAPNKGSSKTQIVRQAPLTADRRTQPMKFTSLVKEEPFLPVPGTIRDTPANIVDKAPFCLPASLPKAENQSGISRDLQNRKMDSDTEKENRKQVAGPSVQPTQSAFKPEPMARSSAFETNGPINTTEACEISGSLIERRYPLTDTDQNGTGTNANGTGSHNGSPNGLRKQCIEKKSPGNQEGRPNAIGNAPPPGPSSPVGNSSSKANEIIVVELPYGSIRTITLTEDDMKRHIPVWNTKLKYKVAGTASPLGKNIARYLESKNGEFEVYNEQDKFESEQARKNARVTIWHKIEKRKISGTSAPLRKNIERYLRDHPHCEVYVDQKLKLDETEKKHANLRVTMWNKKAARKQGFGHSGPLRKNLKRYLSEHPHLEEYTGQDTGISAVNAEEDAQNGHVTVKDGETSLVQNDVSHNLMNSDHPEGEQQLAGRCDGFGSEKLEDLDAKPEPQFIDPNEEWEGDGEFSADHSAHPFETECPLDMSNIPDLNTFPFLNESYDFERFDLEPSYYRPPGYVRQLVDVPGPDADQATPRIEIESDSQDAAFGDVSDAFMGEGATDQIEVEAGIEDDSEPLPVELDPLDCQELFPNLVLDDMLRPDDFINLQD